MKLHIDKMGCLPVGHRQRIRELSLGPVAWGAWSWTFQDGSCWACLAFDGEDLAGWSAVTLEIDMLPVVGVYVAESYRRQGLGSLLLTTLLRYLLGCKVLSPGVEIFNSSWRWSAYDELIQSCGLRSRKWV